MALLQFGFIGILMGIFLSAVCWLLGLVYTLLYSAIFKHN